MVQLHLIKQAQGILIPATPETSDFLQSKCKLGAFLEAEYKLVRNPAFCKHPSFSSTHLLRVPFFQPSAGTLPASGCSGIHEAARCYIPSASAL
nr:DUF1367 family protein [Klebsiella aerogenes]